jgi:hypothetical protein
MVHKKITKWEKERGRCCRKCHDPEKPHPEYCSCLCHER